jgi:hypothetical protein
MLTNDWHGLGARYVGKLFKVACNDNRRFRVTGGIEAARQRRRHERIELEVEVLVRTGSELLPGRTQDISESGMSAILPVELLKGQEVELQIKLPSGTQTARALVRHRNVFRHGFEFVQPLHGIFEAATGA